jgi:hypothetical protein
VPTVALMRVSNTGYSAAGGFNRSSQHLDLEVCAWEAASMGSSCDGKAADAVTGPRASARIQIQIHERPRLPPAVMPVAEEVRRGVPSHVAASLSAETIMLMRAKVRCPSSRANSGLTGSASLTQPAPLAASRTADACSESFENPRNFQL